MSASKPVDFDAITLRLNTLQSLVNHADVPYKRGLRLMAEAPELFRIELDILNKLPFFYHLHYGCIGKKIMLLLVDDIAGIGNGSFGGHIFTAKHGIQLLNTTVQVADDLPTPAAFTDEAPLEPSAGFKASFERVTGPLKAMFNRK